MGLDKCGNIIYRSFYSKCEVCEYYLNKYKCWYSDYINVHTWNGSDYYKCDKFKSIIPNQYNNCYIHPDYEDRDRFPEKVFGGKYRFNSKGEKIGEL